ncbi:MAG: hypothetical protein BWY73_01098 [candidate division TA06 bacterium ADurb.Bin417]|uniref:Competence protein A n=1 Tax=candidate division TA06 bacterium ADurb.Bin417 TaxID=1852828 RepID=A0A1V5MDU0_UNCT6|nr:MAG: hypothetical protein BWY73_01098 [candidate division TA06 bacterium ADurb.Bin417]
MTLGERSLVAAEIQVTGRTSRLIRVVRWPFPDGLTIGAPLGKALRQFLRTQHIAADTAIAGIPAGWLLTKEKTVPPADPSTLANLLKLEAESDFAFPPADLILEYLEATPAADASRPILLIAALRKRIEALQQMAHAAGLKLAAATPSSLALADTAGSRTDNLVLYLGPEEVELVWLSGGAPLIFRRLGKIPAPAADKLNEETAAWAGEIGTAIQKLLFLMPRREGFVEASTISIRNDSGLPETALQALQRALPLPVKTTKGLEVPEPAMANGSRPAAGEAAFRLALAGERPQALPLDFLHPRLTRFGDDQKPLRRRLLIWSASAALVLLLTAAGGWLETLGHQREINALRQKLEEVRPELARTRKQEDRLRSLRAWQNQEPLFLECLREVTLAFPAEGGIWTSNLAIRADLQGLISGKAARDTAVFDLLEGLKRSPAFSQVNVVYIRETGGGNPEVAYAIRFAFLKPSARKSTATEKTR